MRSKRDGKYIDTNSQFFIVEKDGISLYRSHSNVFFLVIPHEKGDLNFTYEGLEFYRPMLARFDTLSVKVTAKYAENWVKKHCPEYLDRMYEPKTGKPFTMLLDLTMDESKKLNRIMAHDKKERKKLEIVKEVVSTWLEKETEKIDKKKK